MAGPRDRLVIFVRAPRIGAVKRRLGADIGAGPAWQFYRGLSADLVRRLARDRRWDTVLAVTPDRFAASGRWWPAGTARLKQGAGDLGRRMARALRTPRGSRALVIGSDIPGITAGHVAAAFRALGCADVVLGPAGDGGYWLIGARAGALPRRALSAVRWSSPDALADTLAGLGHRRVGLVDMLDDVDDGASYRRYRAAGRRTIIRLSQAE